MDNAALIMLEREREHRASQVSHLETLLKQARAELRSFDEAIAAIKGTPIPKVAAKTTLKDTILDILSGGEGFSSQAIKDAVERSWGETELNSIQSTLSRLRTKDNAVKRDEAGLWYLNKQEASGEPEASNEGREAELEDPKQVVQHPAATRENVGSSPTTPAPYKSELLRTSASPQASIFSAGTPSASTPVSFAELFKKPQG